MLLNILTAVSRPENLPKITESLAIAAEKAPNVTVCWRWGFDLERRHVGGQAVKNALLDEVEDGWVWCLDDDTLVHEDILLTASQFLEYDAIVFSQQRSDGRVLAAGWENVTVGGIDIGQALLRRDLIGEHRIPEHYEGDGMFLSAVLTEHVLFHPAALSLHNAISRVEVSV